MSEKHLEKRAPSTRSGPIDDRTWPDKLTAHVVKPGNQPLIHGYDVQSDLIQHYNFSELILLALTGEPPSREIGRAFEIALIFAAPISIAEAPVHAASLSQLVNSRGHGTLGLIGIGLAEQTHYLVESYGDLIEWFGNPEHPFPEAFCAKDHGEQEAVQRLKEALSDTGIQPKGLQHNVSLFGGLLNVFYSCGLQSKSQIETAFMLARFACAAAEAFAVKPLDFKSYPIDLPPFRYIGDRK